MLKRKHVIKIVSMKAKRDIEKSKRVMISKDNRDLKANGERIVRSQDQFLEESYYPYTSFCLQDDMSIQTKVF